MEQDFPPKLETTMNRAQYLTKAARERTSATKAEKNGFPFVAAGFRRNALKLESLAKLASLGRVEESNAS
jgi:hypothetical protein